MPPPSVDHEINGKLLEIIGISRIRIPVDSVDLENIYIPLGLLGVSEDATAGTVDMSRNH